MLTKWVKLWAPPVLLTSLLFGCSSPPQADRLGLHNSQLRPCPDSPNCVSSLAHDSEHQVPALKLRGSPEQSWQKVKSIITALPRTRIVTANYEYLHAECRSAVFGFIDDLELHLRPKEGQIEVRSVARLGYYDFGVNRKRVEQLRMKLREAEVIR
jgi:uncharacterized protein (DUF1499 family)